MSYVKYPNVKTVKYINMKNDLDAEILIPSANNEVSGRSMFTDLRVLQKTISILITTLILVLFLSLVVYFYITNNDQSRQVSEMNEHQKFSCQPLENVEKLLFTLVYSPNNTCNNNSTCYSLLDKIEKDHMGLKYNFVIGSEGELYIGSGFNCRVNDTENTLHIKLLQNKVYFTDREENMRKCLRIMEIVDQGLSCGKISANFSAFYRTSVIGTFDHDITDSLCSDLSPDRRSSRKFHFHDSEHDMGSLIHRDVKWTFCGNFSSDIKKGNKKVITLENFPRQSCLPFQPVSEVVMNVVESPSSQCSDNSSCIHYYEEHHDGLNYNFIFDEHRNIYIGLGFRCRANSETDNILKIKIVISKLQSMFEIWWPVVHFLHEGIYCGMIHENFTLKSICNNKFNYCEELVQEYSFSANFIRYLIPEFDTEIWFRDNHTESGEKFISDHTTYRACHRKHVHSQESTADAAKTSTSTPEHEPTSSSPTETVTDQSTTDATSAHNDEVSEDHFPPTDSHPYWPTLEEDMYDSYDY